jgi:hypothetical protein
VTALRSGTSNLLPDNGCIYEVNYDDVAAFQIVRRFLNNRESFLEELVAETPSLFIPVNE